MQEYWDVFVNGYLGYARYLWYEITHPSLTNYFYWLILVSLFFFSLEVVIPWRKGQKLFRKDFWLDAFYMFFNFFLFSLIVYNAASDVIVKLLNDGIHSLLGIDLSMINPMYQWPLWAVLLVGFFVRDFVQWWVHRLLHRSPRLWEFHKVHHSVEQMGFAAHLRFHWMETVVYRFCEYLPLALLGIGLYDFFVIHIFTLAIGHFNHSNITVSGRLTSGILGLLIGIVIATSSFDVHILTAPSIWTQVIVVLGCALLTSIILGPFMKKVFNNPEMHLWHHVHDFPQEHPYGINFGLSLAIWDYLFGTAYVPKEDPSIKLGFPGVEKFPDSFVNQVTYGFKRDVS
ncbi:MAG: sterol desaturase family protein [Saprospiraceae bacterium]|nr:sterol desaturase family protein [Saprospiraceae bacterium]